MLPRSCLLLLLVSCTRASVFSGAEDVCSLAECRCSGQEVHCQCGQDSSFQVQDSAALPLLQCRDAKAYSVCFDLAVKYDKLIFGLNPYMLNRHGVVSMQPN